MSNEAVKPKYLNCTEALGFKIPLVWCSLAILVGLIFHQVVEAILVPLLTLLMVYLCHKITCFFLSFQEHSGILSDKVYALVIKFIWFSAVLGFSISLLGAAFESVNSEVNFEFFNGVFSIVYFGFVLAAANLWGKTYVPKH
ncbi:MAG: hypothetical protein ACI92T_003211 [Pseudoalteromonas distincta]